MASYAYMGERAYWTFDRWPTGMGFDRFYGILGGEASQWEPAAYDQTTPIEPHIGKDDYHLSEDLADQAIKWIRQQQTSTPDSPFFCYFAPPAVRATPSTERMDRQIRRSV